MTVSEILADPHWFPVHFDVDKDTLTFVKTTRETLSNGAFLDQRFYRQTDQFQAVRLSDALNTSVKRQPMSWIFHTAFCASTLMARALDVPGKALALKEPDIVMQISNAFRMARRAGAFTGIHTRLFDLILSLLSRRFSPTERIVIKPTNPANYLVKEILRSGDPALFMTSPLETFLTSILRKGEEGAAFMRSLYNIYALDGTGISKISERDALRFTDLQITAIIWQHQHEDLTAATAVFPNQTRAIEGLAFPQERTHYMRAASDFLRLELTAEEIEANSEGPVFQKNAKFSEMSFDPTARDKENEQIQAAFADRLKGTSEWQAKLDLGRDYSYLPAQSLL